MPFSILPPTVEDVISEFDLRLLRVPVDLVFENGDLARTKRGDLRLGPVPFNALFRLVQHWRFNVPALRFLFDTATLLAQRKAEAGDNVNRVHDEWVREYMAGNKDRADRSHIPEINQFRDEMGAAEIGELAYAGSVMVLISSILLRLKDDLDATDEEWQQSGPMCGGRSFGQVVVAAANYFRHSDEWSKSYPYTRQQLRSVCVLRDALSLITDAIDVSDRIQPDICPKVLGVLGEKDFDLFSKRMFLFAHDMTERQMRRIGAQTQ